MIDEDEVFEERILVFLFEGRAVYALVFIGETDCHGNATAIASFGGEARTSTFL